MWTREMYISIGVINRWKIKGMLYPVSDYPCSNVVVRCWNFGNCWHWWAANWLPLHRVIYIPIRLQSNTALSLSKLLSRRLTQILVACIRCRLSVIYTFVVPQSSSSCFVGFFSFDNHIFKAVLQNRKCCKILCSWYALLQT